MIKETIFSIILLTQFSYGFSFTQTINQIDNMSKSYDGNVVPVPIDADLQKFINKKNCDQVIDQQIFQICYDYQHKSPKYVGYFLDGNTVNAVNVKERGKFYTEDSLPNQYRRKSADYSHTSYDRGHMANDANFDYSVKALTKTYTMANIVPQSKTLNEKTWLKAEFHERDMAVKYGSIDVINMVFYPDREIYVGKHNDLSIPSGFVKALFNKSKNYKECFYYENEMPVLDQNGKQVMDDKGFGLIHETINLDTDELKDHKIDCAKVGI
jgi:endonuclease G